ncbi:hypothetical protein Gogos_015526, partial [Gossypium gossypioides]|nr:hypothetical protein [Gossypium gossypioides]
RRRCATTGCGRPRAKGVLVPVLRPDQRLDSLSPKAKRKGPLTQPFGVDFLNGQTPMVAQPKGEMVTGGASGVVDVTVGRSGWDIRWHQKAKGQRGALPHYAPKALPESANQSNLLPTDTVFAFQAIIPSFSNNGKCETTHKYKTLGVIVLCSLACFFSSFTDNFGPNGNALMTNLPLAAGILASGLFMLFPTKRRGFAMALLPDSSKQSLLLTFLYSSPNSFSLDRFHNANNSAFAASHESLDANNLLNLEFPFSKFNLVNDGDAKDGYGGGIDGKILGMEKKKYKHIGPFM